MPNAPALFWIAAAVRAGSHIGNEDVDEKKQNGKEDKQQEEKQHTLH